MHQSHDNDARFMKDCSNISIKDDQQNNDLQDNI